MNGQGRRPDEARFHRYLIDGVWEVLAGRTEADNDRLSIKLARPNDWWFHVAGQPGSHVVLRVPAGVEPPKDVLERGGGRRVAQQGPQGRRRFRVGHPGPQRVEAARGQAGHRTVEIDPRFGRS